MNTLERFRTEVGLTQSDIATITGLSRQSVSAIECGMWEHFPKEVHLTLKPIAQDEFGFPWPDRFELTEANYQTSRIDRRVLTRQTTSIATMRLSGPVGPQIVDAAQKTGRHPFTIWRGRAVGVPGIRQFSKLIAINPEVVREFELSRPFTSMPASLEEALLDCGVHVSRLSEIIKLYWTEAR